MFSIWFKIEVPPNIQNEYGQKNATICGCLGQYTTFNPMEDSPKSHSRHGIRTSLQSTNQFCGPGWGTQLQIPMWLKVVAPLKMLDWYKTIHFLQDSSHTPCTTQSKWVELCDLTLRFWNLGVPFCNGSQWPILEKTGPAPQPPDSPDASPWPGVKISLSLVTTHFHKCCYSSRFECQICQNSRRSQIWFKAIICEPWLVMSSLEMTKQWIDWREFFAFETEVLPG